MITVTITDTGDSAEAETPEDALFAALTIAREAKAHRRIRGYNPVVRFDVDGTTVRTLSLRDLMR